MKLYMKKINCANWVKYKNIQKLHLYERSTANQCWPMALVACVHEGEGGGWDEKRRGEEDI